MRLFGSISLLLLHLLAFHPDQGSLVLLVFPEITNHILFFLRINVIF